MPAFASLGRMTPPYANSKDYTVPSQLCTIASARIRTWNSSSEDCCDIRFTTEAIVNNLRIPRILIRSNTVDALQWLHVAPRITSARRSARSCARYSTTQGFEAYLVGGCVRDLLLGREPKDWDITTNARPEQIQALFEETFYENEYGTVGVVTQSENPRLKVVEITPYRYRIRLFKREASRYGRIQ